MTTAAATWTACGSQTTVRCFAGCSGRSCATWRLSLAPLDPGQTRDIELTTAAAGVLDANELGWKDTFRVNPGERDADDNVVSAEMVTMMGCFASHCGKVHGPL